MDDVRVTLEFSIEEAVFIADTLLEKSDDTSVKFETREEAYNLHDYVNRRVLEECGEI